MKKFIVISCAALGLYVLSQGEKPHGSTTTANQTAVADTLETYRLVFTGENDANDTVLAAGMTKSACQTAKAATRAQLNPIAVAQLDSGIGYFGCQPESSY